MDGRLKVSAVQVTVYQNNIEANMENVERMAMKVAQNEQDVDLILFHEACLESGIPLETFDEALTERIVEFWKGIAAKTGTNILAGRLERKDGVIYNKATVFTPEGEILADYAKIHLYNSERDTIEPGKELGMFELNGMKIGIMICADFGFPELARTYAVNGCHVLAVTSSWAYPDDDLWVICNQARSSENGIYVVSCDRTGPSSPGVIKVGRSMVCDPDGFILSNLVEKTDTYYVQTLYRDEVEKRHQTMRWLQWLRPELYTNWMNSSWPDADKTNEK
ncbi:carbon-nitrogen hydrolase family protein [Roseburia hominis]